MLEHLNTPVHQWKVKVSLQRRTRPAVHDLWLLTKYNYLLFFNILMKWSHYCSQTMTLYDPNLWVYIQTIRRVWVCPTFPSSRASPPRATRALRGGRMKAGGSLLWELHPGDRADTWEMVDEADANWTLLILLPERKYTWVTSSTLQEEEESLQTTRCPTVFCVSSHTSGCFKYEDRTISPDMMCSD